MQSLHASRQRKSWVTRVIFRRSSFFRVCPLEESPLRGASGPPTGPLASFLAPYGENEFLPQRQFTRGPSGRGGSRVAKTTIRGAKKWFPGPLDTYRGPLWCPGGTLEKSKKSKFWWILTPLPPPPPCVSVVVVVVVAVVVVAATH